MMTLLIHAGNIQGISDINYDLDKNDEKNYDENIDNNNYNNKDSVSLKRCISHSINQNKLDKLDNKKNELNNIPLPTSEELSEFNYQNEVNINLLKEKAEIEEFYKNIFNQITLKKIKNGNDVRL